MIIVRVLLFFLVLFSGVHNFDAGWTSKYLLSKDATHYTMTECALLDMASEYLKVIYGITSVESVIKIEYGQCSTRSIYRAINIELDKLKIDKKRLVSAIESVAETNRRQDRKEMTNEAVHFDSETFDEGALLISRLFDATLSSVNMEDYTKAKESFGSLLHTVQDFYSHSNWIEIGHRVPNKGIGKYQILGKYADKRTRTCVNCDGDSCRTNIVPSIIQKNILTSGYFRLPVGSYSNPKPVGKCSHGGIFDWTTFTDAKGGGINKDKLISVHGHLHQTAASVAYNATKQILKEFWTRIGNEPFGRFLGLSESLRNRSSNSLIIVMDTTGSMGPYIAMAKQIAIGIVNVHQELEYKPSNYILSPFNDPTWGPLTISLNPQEFTNEISKLSADGGGDTPELYYHGILNALKKCEVGSSLYAFTDAPAKDAYLKSQTIQLAREKQVTVTLFYARNRRRTKQTGGILIKATDVIEDLMINNGNDLSSITGGVVMGIDSQSLNATQDYIIDRLDTSKMKIIILRRGYNMNLTFYVDSSMKSLRIEVTSKTRLKATSFFLVKPSNEVFKPKLIYQTSYLLIFTVAQEILDTGEWTIVSPMNVDHTIQLNAISEISCSSSLQQEIMDRSSSKSFAQLTTQPIQGKPDILVLTICENMPSTLKNGYVYLIDANNGSNVLEILTPTETSSTGFLTRMVVPNRDFRISTITHLQDGSRVQRQQSRVFSPTRISLTIDDQPYQVILNNTLSINYTIYNYDDVKLEIVLRVTDSLGLLSSSGILKSYNLNGMSNMTDTIEMPTDKLDATDFNSTMMINSVIFSIAARDYEYDEAASVYIQEKEISLTNQTDYQQPPPQTFNSAAEKSSLWSIIFILLYLRCFYLTFS